MVSEKTPTLLHPFCLHQSLWQLVIKEKIDFLLPFWLTILWTKKKEQVTQTFKDYGSNSLVNTHLSSSVIINSRWNEINSMFVFLLIIWRQKKKQLSSLVMMIWFCFSSMIRQETIFDIIDQTQQVNILFLIIGELLFLVHVSSSSLVITLISIWLTLVRIYGKRTRLLFLRLAFLYS